MMSKYNFNVFASPLFENAVGSLDQFISERAQTLCVDKPTIEKQVRLHLPLVMHEFDDRFAVNVLRRLTGIIDRRFTSFQKDYSNYLDMSGATPLLNKDALISGETIVSSDRFLLFNYLLQTVDTATGEYIESKLHYLRISRPDAIARFGVFIEGYEMPICYMSFSIIDRNYHISALRFALNKNIDINSVVQLSRVYGFGNLPHNTISKLISHSRKSLNYQFNYMITAINPLLGFDGYSMYASGFVPFASCPVGYHYDMNDEYCSRRAKLSTRKNASFEAPPNMLLVRGLNSPSEKLSSKIDNLQSILVQDIDFEINFISQVLRSVRTSLEKVWNELTIYHRTIRTESDPVSKGQCGVTTAYLAKFFENLNYLVSFCEGTAFFPNNTTIPNHCWIKIVYTQPDRYRPLNLIIDLTSDQNGYPESVICDTVENLNNKGIDYQPTSEVSVSQISNKGLLDRLSILNNALEKLFRDPASKSE